MNLLFSYIQKNRIKTIFFLLFIFLTLSLIFKNYANDVSLPKEFLVLSQESPPQAYFFQNGKSCSVLFNFSSQKESLEKMSSNDKLDSIIKTMFIQYNNEHLNYCPDVESVTMLGAYIDGFDSYGRPDFGARIEIVRVEADEIKIKDNFKKIKNLSLDEIKKFSKVEIL